MTSRSSRLVPSPVALRLAAAALVLVASALATGCLDTPGVRCADDSVCADGTVCDLVHDRCVAPQDKVACADRADGTACDVGGRPVGLCQQGVCLRAGCGDGLVRGAEQCDGADLGAFRDCTDLGFHLPGTLACASDCTYDRAQCGGFCGDGVINGDEDCDGSKLGGATCVGLGHYDGDLGCRPDCSFDVAACGGSCGDDVVNGGEQCDGPDFGGRGCTHLGFYTGNVQCAADCSRIDTSLCVGSCGDRVRNGREACDPADPNPGRCETLGWYEGNLGCSDDCTAVDTSACVGSCGDGVVNGREECDGADQRNQTCATFNGKGGSLGCGAFCQTTLERCYFGSWRPYDIGGGEVAGLWGTARDDVWAVGAGGLVLHHDGARWTGVDAGSVDDLRTVRGTGRDDVWVTGARDILHFDGAVWDRLAIDDGDRGVAILDASGTWPDDVWVITSDGLRHHDGTAWTSVQPGPPAAPVVVWSTGSGDAWLAGGNTISHRHDGSWQTTTFAGAALRGVWAGGDDDVWVYGNTAVRWDGLSWRVVPGSNFELRRLWGTPDGEILAYDGSSLLERDGGQWHKVEMPAAVTSAMWGTAVDDLWAARGDELVHFDGPSWSNVAPDLRGTVTGAWAATAHDLWTVAGPLVARHDGSVIHDTWTAPDGKLNDIWGSRTADVWVVGSTGQATRFDGTRWIPFPVAPGVNLTAISGSGRDDVWAVGRDVVARFDGIQWRLVDGAQGPWVDVRVTGRGDVWVLASDGRLGHVENGRLRVVQVHPDTVEMRGLWASGPNDVWMVGARGRIFHSDGTTVRRVPSPTVRGLYAVWGSSPSDLWAVGDGVAVHYDGADWALMPAAQGAMRAVTGTRVDAVWAAGEGGRVARYLVRPPRLTGGACAAPIPLQCGSLVTGSGAGAVPSTDRYPCASGDLLAGEIHYRLDSQVTGRVTMTLVNHGGDLDLIAIGSDARGGCDVDTCRAASQHDGSAGETIELDLVQGDRIYLVLDARAPTTSGYTLEVTCDKR